MREAGSAGRAFPRAPNRELDHAHLKFYPLFSVKEKFEEVWADKRVFFDKYEGYLTTLLGPKANEQELEKIAKLIRNKNSNRKN